MSDKDLWVVCGDGAPQREFVGKTKLSRERFEIEVDQGSFIELHEAMCIKTMHIPTPQGVAMSTQCIPLNFNRGPINMLIKPVWVYFPEDDAEGFSFLKKQLEIAEQAAAAHRAKDSGLVLPKNPLMS